MQTGDRDTVFSAKLRTFDVQLKYKGTSDGLDTEEGQQGTIVSFLRFIGGLLD